MSPERTCAIDECEGTVFARQWCNSHYKKWWRHGDPEKPRRKPEPERFEERFRKAESCWPWTGSHMVNGYGKFRVDDGKQVLAHRYSYEHHVGPIPDGLVIDHLCRTRNCVNPDHLEPVTNEENLRRGEGYGLLNGMRSACVNGHEYTLENTYTDPKGKNRCRACSRARYYKEKRAA